MTASSVRIERADAGFVRIQLHRPGCRNALDASTVEALIAALEEDPATLVLLGSTSPAAFCAGADLSVPDSERARVSDLLYDCYRVMVERPGPVIALVEAAAVGGGAQLATAADFRLAGPAARFRWVGPGHGLAVGSWILPSLVGRARALDLTLTGRWVSATEALNIGLVTDIAQNPWSVAETLARQLLSLDADAVARTKAIISSDGLLDRLLAEKIANQASWSGSMAGLQR